MPAQPAWLPFREPSKAPRPPPPCGGELRAARGTACCWLGPRCGWHRAATEERPRASQGRASPQRPQERREARSQRSEARVTSTRPASRNALRPLHLASPKCLRVAPDVCANVDVPAKAATRGAPGLAAEWRAPCGSRRAPRGGLAAALGGEGGGLAAKLDGSAGRVSTAEMRKRCTRPRAMHTTPETRFDDQNEHESMANRRKVTCGSTSAFSGSTPALTNLSGSWTGAASLLALEPAVHGMHPVAGPQPPGCDKP